MAVVLKILSIIGLVILCLLALIIFLLLLVLFVPVRYMAAGSFKENTLNARAKMSWLFHIFSFSYTYGKEEPLSFRVFGIRIKKKEPKEKTLEEDNINEQRTEAFEKKLAEESEKPTFETDISEVDIAKKPVESSDSQDKENFSDGISDDEFNKETSKKQKKVSTKDNICDKIKKYIEIIKSDKFQKTYSYAKVKIKKLLKHILPRKWEINALLGFDDPSVTGNILVYSSVLYPFIAKHIHVHGDFNNQIIDVDGKAKGRITVFKAAIIGLQLYFNKDIKKVLKMFEEV